MILICTNIVRWNPDLVFGKAPNMIRCLLVCRTTRNLPLGNATRGPWRACGADVCQFRLLSTAVARHSRGIEGTYTPRTGRSCRQWFTMAIPTLPIDVIKVIFDTLRGETATLRACAAVCDDWLGAARPPLFHSLYFTAAAARCGGASSSQDVFDASVAKLSDRLRELAAFLGSSPAVGNMVREFTIRDSAKGDRKAAPPAAAEMHILQEALSKMSNLHSLTFIGIWCIFPPSTIGVCASVRSITLKGLNQKFPVHPNYPWTLVTHFPDVTDVRIDQCVTNMGSDDAEITQSNRVRLRSLTVSGCWPLGHWCNFHRASLQSLQELKLATSCVKLWPRDYATVRRILGYAGNHLRRLCLSIGSISEPSTLHPL